jgi:hypothetical protein
MQQPLRPQHPQEHARAAVKRDLQNGSLTAAANLAATPAATPTGTPFPVKPKRVGHSGRRPRYCHRWPGCRPLPALRPAALRPAALRPAALRPAALRPATLRPAALRPAALRPAALRPAMPVPVPRGGGAAATTSADSATKNVTSAAATAAAHPKQLAHMQHRTHPDQLPCIQLRARAGGHTQLALQVALLVLHVRAWPRPRPRPRPISRPRPSKSTLRRCRRLRRLRRLQGCPPGGGGPVLDVERAICGPRAHDLGAARAVPAGGAQALAEG